MISLVLGGSVIILWTGLLLNILGRIEKLEGRNGA